MPTDKTVEIDLNDLTADSLGKLAEIQKEIADDLDKTGKRKTGKKGKSLRDPATHIGPSNLKPLTQKQAERLEKRREKQLQKIEGKQKKIDEKIDARLEKLKKQVELDLINGKGKETLKSKLFGKQDFSKGGIAKNLVKFGLNPGGVVGGLLSKGVPGFAAAVASTAIIVKILKKFDDLEKKFTDNIRTRLNQDRDNEQTARIQAGLAQEIFTAGPGVTDPRDQYNTFDEDNGAVIQRETNYAIRSTQGVE